MGIVAVACVWLMALATRSSTEFIQASSANLRAAPSPGARRVLELPINQAMVVEARDVGDDRGWCKVRTEAADHHGFIRCELLAPAPVDLETVLKVAHSTTLPLAETWPAAQRALALAPEDASVRARFVELFWRFEMEQLRQARAAGTLNTKRPRLSTETSSARDPAEKIALACARGERCVVGWPGEQEGCAFGCAVLRGEALTVHSGRWCCDCEADGAITLERTSTMYLPRRALAALFSERTDCTSSLPGAAPGVQPPSVTAETSTP